ncbi:M56 family metallopeptidase [Clostridioides sp. ES-S-0108-01]|uniref:M56 family metallopeptidase n=1 Tax=unclassified Clostridioides TaxID=2635829 RepID=UPI001D0C2BBE|nr:M56 family metallopeptidase [Clostridioides sp. ES-S-0107-01]MCC0785086.1 M56 family metallopeptidase [Clostridioides sp. ES-S-0108-01]UDN53133.1 M56 family metallopeptidase [Clostridioides sp. ES-S-0107-01]
MIQIFKSLLNTTIVSSTIICIFLLLKISIFRIFNKRFNYYIWLIVIFKMLFFTFSYSIFINDQTIINKLNTYGNTRTVDNTILFLLSIVWLFVALSLLVNIFVKYNKEKNLLIDLSEEVDIIEINSIFENLKIELNVKQNVTLRFSYDISSPCVLGLFKPYVLLTNSYNVHEIYWILKHELIHVKNRDNLIKFIMAFLRCLYWFNPLVYLMSRKISEDCELHCDEIVMQNSSKKEQQLYGLTLINSARFNNEVKNVLMTEFYKTNLEKRLDNIVHIKTRKGILIVLILCLLSSITYLKFESLSSDSLVHQIPKQLHTKIENNSKREFLVQVNTDD